ncbi:MAG: hypothetical protein JXQ82_07785 [Methanomicrobiaceae archaeon]|nr:hypothetical protein [Methanomicrobiaceae archaeon]
MSKEPVPVWICDDCKNKVEGTPQEKKCPYCGATLTNVELQLKDGLAIKDSIEINILQYIKPFFNISLLLIFIGPIMSSIISVLVLGVNGILLSFIMGICFALIGFYIGKNAIEKTKILFEKSR